MSPLDEHIRDLLSAAASDPPRTVMFRDVQRGYQRRRTRITAGMGVAVAAVVAAAATIPTFALSGGTQRLRVGTNVPVEQNPPPSIRSVGYRGVEVAVPAGWPDNATACGTPLRNTVVYTYLATPACLYGGRTPVVSVVRIGPATPAPRGSASSTRTVDGVPVTSYTTRTRPDLTDILLTVPSRGVSVRIDSPDPSLAQRIAASLQVVNIDPARCVVHPRNGIWAIPTRPTWALNNPRIVPTGATTLTACSYHQGWLTRSASTSGTAVTHLITALDRAPTGSTDLRCPTASRTRPQPGDQLLTTFGYPNGRTLPILFRLYGCSGLGAASGTQHRQETAAWVFPLVAAAQYPGAFPDPRQLP